MPLKISDLGINKDVPNPKIVDGGIIKPLQKLFISDTGINKEINIKPRLYLYNYGDQCTAITGGWEGTSGTGANNGVTFNSDHMSLYIVNTTTGYCRASTKNYLSGVNLASGGVRLGIKWKAENVNANANINGSFGNTILYAKGINPCGSPFDLREDTKNLAESLNGWQFSIFTNGGVNKHIVRVYQIWVE